MNKNAFKNFIKLFKDYKIKIFFIIILAVTSIILSILVPLKTGNIIDNVLNNITIKNNNQKTHENIDAYIPFIKEIELINYEALREIKKDAVIEDLITIGLIKESSMTSLNENVKERLLKAKVNNFENIDCYECSKKEEYITPINSINKIINVNTIALKQIETKQIIIDLATVVTFVFLTFAINYYNNKEMCKVSKCIILDLRNKVSQKILKISLKDIHKNKEGDVLSLVANDLDNISNTISIEVVGIINACLLLVSLFIIMFRISIKLTLIIIAMIPIMVALLLIIIVKTSKYYELSQEILGNYNDFILNSYKGYKTIKSYNQKEKFIDKEQKLNKELYINIWKSNFYSSLLQPIVQFISNINFLIVLIFGGIMVVKGNITLGNLQAFLTYAKNFNNPLINIASTLGIIEQTLASSERIHNFLNLNEEEELNKYEKFDFKQKITFDHVSFSYADKLVLKNVCFTINPGEKVAIVGETGSGKTTLIKLLLNLYEPNSGSIRIGDKNICQINKQQLRDNMAVVLQDTWLFEGTIKENIAYGSKRKNIKAICKEINLDKIIKKLPNNYNFLIKESSSLSKGEKQLISIARAFIQNKNILILDEATSNIDINTEMVIEEATKKIMKDKACVIIAHRLSTIINSDKILVMHNGEIIEIGTHDELIKVKGHYYKMYQSQFE